MTKHHPRLASGLVCLALASALGCAGKARDDVATPGTPPVQEVEMDPIKLHGVKGPDGVQHVETYDATELFERAGAALSDKRYPDAIRDYERLLKEFPTETRYTKAALYNCGLAYQGAKDWPNAIARLDQLAKQYPGTSDAKDALFQIGATYAEMGNWPTSATMFAELLQRSDLTSDDKIEAMARRGFAQFQLRDFETAERTFKQTVWYFQSIEKEERLQTDFYLGLVKYHLAQIPHEKFRAAPLRLPDKQMAIDLEEKCRLLLVAQRAYIDAMKLGNPQWASASGYQVASLYEELYDAFVHAPIPPDLLTEENAEKREVYYEELRKKIRVLLEKSLRWNEQNLLMIERLGIDNEWRDKSKLAYAKLQKMLDPSFKVEFADPNAPATPAAPKDAPPTPTAPDGRPGMGGGGEPLERKADSKPKPTTDRQIL
ncbi:MAG TPA: tetratricopeptide repeat protein [Polyangia bacterium]|nr:tetratricopeptide repeat protein [Polyangia bacterium]